MFDNAMVRDSRDLVILSIRNKILHPSSCSSNATQLELHILPLLSQHIPILIPPLFNLDIEDLGVSPVEGWSPRLLEKELYVAHLTKQA